MFGHDWEPAQATIVAVRHVPTGFSTTGYVAEFVADIHPEGGLATFRATFKGPHRSMNFRTPDVGEVIAVRVDSKSGEVKIDPSDPGVRLDAAREREQEEFDALAAAPPGSGLPAAAAPEPEVSAALADVSAATARLQATSADISGTLAAISRAKAAGDRDEVERLKAEFAARRAEQKQSPPTA
jgi:hypothetical protein